MNTKKIRAAYCRPSIEMLNVSFVRPIAGSMTLGEMEEVQETWDL